MKTNSAIAVVLLGLLLFTMSEALKLGHRDSDEAGSQEVPSDIPSLIPLTQGCDQNVTCWRERYFFDGCQDDDLECWKKANRIPQNCQPDQFDCWMEQFGYKYCEENDAECVKNVVKQSNNNINCQYDDLECWRKAAWRVCKWNDWQCLVNNEWYGSDCQDKTQAFECVKKAYASDCQQTDQQCWRLAYYWPTKQCDEDIECFKDRYSYLPICKDDDIECWEKFRYGPKCQKGDMNCLRQYFSIPDCSNPEEELKCYKLALGYPDCDFKDGECWKTWGEKRVSDYWHMKSQKSHKSVSSAKKISHQRDPNGPTFHKKSTLKKHMRQVPL